jgi:hypothetical protein
MSVSHRQRQHLPVPAQVVHPLQARDLVERLPGVAAELRLEPGAKGQRRNAERRAGEVLGAAQGLHARRRRPGAFEAGRCFVVGDDRDAALDQRRGEGQSGHAGADDRDVGNGRAVVLERRRPARRRQLQEGELVGEARLEGREAARHGRRRGAVIAR